MSSVFCHQEFEVVRKQLRKYIAFIRYAHAIKILIVKRDYGSNPAFPPRNTKKYTEYQKIENKKKTRLSNSQVICRLQIFNRRLN